MSTQTIVLHPDDVTTVRDDTGQIIGYLCKVAQAKTKAISDEDAADLKR